MKCTGSSDERQVENTIKSLEKKYTLLTRVSLTGILAGIEKNKRIYKIAFILADIALIICTISDLLYNIKIKKGRFYQ